MGTPVQQALWIDEPAGLERLVETLCAEPVYALDTEFHRERTYFPRTALLQLAWQGGLALVDPLAVDVGPLRRVLSGPGLAILHAAEQDLEVLQHVCGCGPTRLFDTQIAASFLGRGFASLARLVQDVIGQRLPKGDRLTDWTRRPLTGPQLEYAAADVAHLLTIESTLRREAEQAGVLGWVEEECERMRSRPQGAPDPETAWWRIKGSRGLPQRQKAVAQEVAGWRERSAARRDLPPRFVLSELALAGIVHRSPNDAADLEQVRGWDPRAARGTTAAEILEAVQRGLAMPLEQIRVPPRGEPPLEEAGPLVALGVALVAGIAAERHFEPSMLASRGDVQAYLSGRSDTRVGSGWRRDIVAGALDQLRSGEIALASDGAGGIRTLSLGSRDATGAS